MLVVTFGAEVVVFEAAGAPPPHADSMSAAASAAPPSAAGRAIRFSRQERRMAVSAGTRRMVLAVYQSGLGEG